VTARQNSKTPSLAEVIRAAITQQLSETYVSLPGRIEKYDAGEQKADVLILLRRTLVDEDGNELEPETLPILHDVPVMFNQGGGFFQSWPIKEGDLVKVDFMDWSMDQFLGGNGELTTPLDFRKHSLSDAVCSPKLYPPKRALADAHPENAVWGKDGGTQIHCKDDEIDLGSENAADFVALSQKVFDELDSLKTTVNDFITAHKLPGAHTTTATVGPSAVPGVVTSTIGTLHGPVNSVAADKVKAD
jgi:hypothetical protein